jgi:hypothetical protein
VSDIERVTEGQYVVAGDKRGQTVCQGDGPPIYVGEPSNPVPPVVDGGSASSEG